jgi:predicted transcriptional regulator
MSLCAERTVRAIAERLRIRAWTVRELASDLHIATATVGCAIQSLRDVGLVIRSAAVSSEGRAGRGRPQLRYWMEDDHA